MVMGYNPEHELQMKLKGLGPAEGKAKTLIDYRHSEYLYMAHKWEKWRLVYEGGDEFVDEYVKSLSNREDPKDLQARKCVTPTAAFAKMAVNEVKNSIFQRMAEVIRRGGPDSYQAAIRGQEGGVDMRGSSMNMFIGRDVLPELLTMRDVGVFVDMPQLEGSSVLHSKGKHPYVYRYHVEDILNWTYMPGSSTEFQALLLRDHVDKCCETTHLPLGEQWCRYRYVFLQDGKVHVQFFNENCSQIDLYGNPFGEDYILNIPAIPFVMACLTDSLLNDIASYQIALVNLESSDISYACKSNVPFYTEQVDAMELLSERGPDDSGDGTAAEAGAAKPKEIKVGSTIGRRYAAGMDRPDFIHPSAEPLQVSIEKQRALKEDIRQLVSLAVSTVGSKSAESKRLDDRGLESGLSYIGLELQNMENKIAQYWAMYSGKSTTSALVSYPAKYSLESDEDRRKAIEQLEDIRDTIPSPLFQKTISKKMVFKLLGHELPSEELDKIYAEIDKAESITCNPDTLFAAVDRNVLAPVDCEKLLGLPKGSAERATEAHAERAAAIVEAQAAATPDSEIKNAAARGVSDLSVDPEREGEEEKAQSQDTTLKTSTKPRVRGKGQPFGDAE